MFGKLKLKSLRKKQEKNLKQRDTSNIHSSLETMAFLIEETDSPSIETLRNIASSLGIDKDNFEVLAFQKYDKKIELKKYQIHHKHIKWNGSIDHASASQFLKQPFDVLIGFYNCKHDYLDFLVSESAARFKVGLSKSDIMLFDLQINIDKSDTAALTAELDKYLQVLGKVS